MYEDIDTEGMWQELVEYNRTYSRFNEVGMLLSVFITLGIAAIYHVNVLAIGTLFFAVGLVTLLITQVVVGITCYKTLRIPYIQIVGKYVDTKDMLLMAKVDASNRFYNLIPPLHEMGTTAYYLINILCIVAMVWLSFLLNRVF